MSGIKFRRWKYPDQEQHIYTIRAIFLISEDAPRPLPITHFGSVPSPSHCPEAQLCHNHLCIQSLPSHRLEVPDLDLPLQLVLLGYLCIP